MNLGKKIFDENKLNICQVSLPGNIPIIKDNYKNFNKFYKNNYFFVICPKKDLKIFKKKLKFKNIKIINEDTLIKFSKFKTISNKYLKNKIYYTNIKSRLKWYYQQILKISFAFKFIEESRKNIIIWDADTIIINKLNFFINDKQSNQYGTTSYFHRAYYDTNKTILGALPKYFISSLSQFISITPNEMKYLSKKLNRRKKRKKNTAEWLSTIIMEAVSLSHQNYNGSMFSEYELIGQSNLLFNYNKQKLVSGIRDHLNGKLTFLQIKILKYLGFTYIAYEHTHPNNNSKNMLNRNQTWIDFLKILTNKMSNNIFRGLRHHYFFLVHLFKPTVW